jgi:hypothetical protein
MAMLPKTFKTSEAPSNDITIPEGNYLAHVIKSELKDNSKGTGKYLAFTVQVIDGDHKGFTLFDIMNIVHTNKVAEDIGNRQLAQLISACGLEEIEDTAELHGIPVCVIVVTEDANNGYPAKSKIRKYISEDKYEA